MKAVPAILYVLSLAILEGSRRSSSSTINYYGSLLSLNSSEDLSSSVSNDPSTPQNHDDSTTKKDTTSQVKNDDSQTSDHAVAVQEAPDANKQRYVFAHVLAGNAQNYTKDDWVSDMKTAQGAHIDAFAINIGKDASNDVQLPLIYECAESVGFKVFISFDMTYYAYSESSKEIQRRVLQFTNHQAQFKYENKTYISTFSGEVPGTYMDNNQNYTAAWCALKDSLSQSGVQTYFVPGWTGTTPSMSLCAEGLLSWDAWPHNGERLPANVEEINTNLTTQEALYLPDKASMMAAKTASKSFAAPVSPLFFKHINSSSKFNFVYSTDDWMMINRYSHLINQPSPPEFIELLSWNDYGESHYLRDPQPSANLPEGAISSHQYVDGFSHAALLNLLSYFNQWYKNGQPPTMNQTTVYIWYRPHVKNAVASDDELPAPNFANLTKDRIYGYVIPAPNTTVTTVKISSGYQVLEQAVFSPRGGENGSASGTKKGPNLSQIVEDHSNNNQVQIGGTGILLSAPLEPGNQIVELLNQKGDTLVSLHGIQVQPIPKTYNFNYWSGSIAF